MSDYSLPKAVDYEDLSAKGKAGVIYGGRILQPKWDGCALVVKYDAGAVISAVSASGKPVKSCDHLVHQIVSAVPVLRPFTACAEVWNTDMEFQLISGAFRRHTHQPHLLARWFDFAYDNEQHLPYTERTAWMNQCEDIHFAGHMLAANEAHAWETARYWKRLGGFDGAILREPGSPFTLGRSKGDIIKLKPTVSHDLLCVDVQMDTGAKTGRPTAALVCRWRDGRFQKVATGLSNEQMANALSFLGKIIEVEAMGYTVDGYLREPRFKGERDDKLTPDF